MYKMEKRQLSWYKLEHKKIREFALANRVIRYSYAIWEFITSNTFFILIKSIYLF